MFNQTSMRTYLYKACPRCHGDLVLDPEAERSLTMDSRIEYICLQCGRPTTIENASAAKTPAVASRAA